MSFFSLRCELQQAAGHRNASRERARSPELAAYPSGTQPLLPSRRDRVLSSRSFPASNILVVLKSSVGGEVLHAMAALGGVTSQTPGVRRHTEAGARTHTPASRLTSTTPARRLTSTLAPMITCHTSSSSCEFIFPSKLVYCRYKETRV